MVTGDLINATEYRVGDESLSTRGVVATSGREQKGWLYTYAAMRRKIHRVVAARGERGERSATAGECGAYRCRRIATATVDGRKTVKSRFAVRYSETRDAETGDESATGKGQGDGVIADAPITVTRASPPGPTWSLIAMNHNGVLGKEQGGSLSIAEETAREVASYPRVKVDSRFPGYVRRLKGRL